MYFGNTSRIFHEICSAACDSAWHVMEALLEMQILIDVFYGVCGAARSSEIVCRAVQAVPLFSPAIIFLCFSSCIASIAYT